MFLFIIRIGDDDYLTAQYISRSTGGVYYNVSSIADMGDIYAQIYRMEKQLYLIEFEDISGIDLFDEISIVAGYHTAEYGGEIHYDYTPYTLVNVDDNSILPILPRVLKCYQKLSIIN